MKITNNESNIIHHIISYAHSTINSLGTKVKKLWDQLVNLLTFETNNDNRPLEKIVTIPTKQTEELVVSWTFEEPIVTRPEENELLYANREHLYEEIDCEEPIYEEILESIYEEIPAAKELFLPKEEPHYDVPIKPLYAAVRKDKEPIYQVPMNNQPVTTRSSEKVAVERGLKNLIADIESHLDNAKKSMPSKLSVLEGSEIST